jgi:hypothetical protein
MLIGAAFLWSLGGLFIKIVDLHPVEITGIRSLGAATVFSTGCRSTILINKPPKLHKKAAPISIKWAEDDFT